MSGGGPQDDGPEPGIYIVMAVLTPILAGTAAVIFLAAGYGLSLLTPEPAIAPPMLQAGWTFLACMFGGVIGGTVHSGTRTAWLRGWEGFTGLDSFVRRSVTGITSLATYLAGHRRAHLGREWCAHLAGDTDQGIQLARWERLRTALGFLTAALVMRWTDVASVLWRPVDWVLRTDRRADTLISGLAGALTVYLVAEDGFRAVVGQESGGIALVIAALCGTKRWLRGVREIEVQTPRRRPPREPL